MPSTTYRAVSTATTNAAVVKASPGVLWGYYITNLSILMRFVKLYNLTSAPSSGSTAFIRMGIPGEGAANVALTSPIEFTVGIGIAIVTTLQDSAFNAIGADEVAVTLVYE